MNLNEPPPSAVSSRSPTNVSVSFLRPTAMYSRPRLGTTPEERAFIIVTRVLRGISVIRASS